MKVLTICQPYAELIARGQKRVENRVWSTRYRGPLLIHAGKSREWLGGDTDIELAKEFGRRIEFGAIVAKCQLIDCLDIELIERGNYRKTYPWLDGDPHASGPWCWVLDEIERLPEAIPWKGAQGLWDYSFTPAVSDQS